MFDELSESGESEIRRRLGWKDEILEREKQKRIPAICPFCEDNRREFLLRFWVAHYYVDGAIQRDHADGIQVFCAECEEEIRAEDVRFPSEAETKTDLKEHNIHKDGGVENDE